MDNSDGKRHIFLHFCHMVLDRDEGYTTKTKNTGEKPPNPAIFLDSTSLLEVFWGRKQEIPLEKATFFVVSDRDEGSATKMKRLGKNPTNVAVLLDFMVVFEVFWEKTGNSAFPCAVPGRDEGCATKLKKIGKKSPKPKGFPGLPGGVGLFWEEKSRKTTFPAFQDEVYAIKAKRVGKPRQSQAFPWICCRRVPQGLSRGKTSGKS